MDRGATHSAETIGVLEGFKDLDSFDEEFELGLGLHDDKKDAPEKYKTKQDKTKKGENRTEKNKRRKE